MLFISMALKTNFKNINCCKQLGKSIDYSDELENSNESRSMVLLSLIVVIELSLSSFKRTIGNEET